MEVQPLVEDALATHFGCRVPLTLVVDSNGADTGRLFAASVEATAGPVAQEADDLDEPDFDPDDPGVPADESVVEARLLQAFPGAEEVNG
jgi:hypothetical protein